MQEKAELSIVIPLLEPDEEFYRLLASIHVVRDSFCSVEVVVISKNYFVLSEEFCYVRVLVEARRGIYNAMNQGLKEVTGQFVYFIGKDDFLLPSFANLSRELIGNHDIYLFDTVWGGGIVYKNYQSKLFLIARNWCHQGVIYRRSTLVDSSLTFPRCFTTQADHYINIRLAWKGCVSIRRVRSLSAYYSATGFSTVVKDQMFKRLYPLVLKKYCGRTYYWLLLFFRLARGK
jgi:glycosyltransferase involved in cell wall biosynthesis